MIFLIVFDIMSYFSGVLRVIYTLLALSLLSLFCNAPFPISNFFSQNTINSLTLSSLASTHSYALPFFFALLHLTGDASVRSGQVWERRVESPRMHTAERFWSGRTPVGWNIKIAIKRRYRCRERCFDTVSGIRQALLLARANKRNSAPFLLLPPASIIGARCPCPRFFPFLFYRMSSPARRVRAAADCRLRGQGRARLLVVCDFPARLEISRLSTERKGDARLLYPAICSFETNCRFYSAMNK